MAVGERRLAYRSADRQTKKSITLHIASKLAYIRLVRLATYFDPPEVKARLASLFSARTDHYPHYYYYHYYYYHYYYQHHHLININRPAPGPSYTPDMNSSTRGGSDYNYATSQVQAVAGKIEDAVDIYSQPLRPHLASIGRFLIVVTFLEDALRIMTQWGDQVWYLQKHRGFPWGISHFFLIFNIITMLTGSGAIIARRYSEIAVAGLLGVVIIQGFGYGLIFDLNFFLRNLSVVGGLIMVFSDTMQSSKKRFAGLPSLSENDRRMYFQLAGRVLLIFLFVGFVLNGEWSVARAFVSVFGLAACGMVAVGFKAKWSASFLVVLLSVFNVFINNWWSVHSAHPQRDFLKYDFFQTLSIVGGLLLLVNMGPGGMSIDEKKKNY